MSARVLEILSLLVAADTRNPPRRIGHHDALFPALQKLLEAVGFTVELRDLARGSVSLYAVRGRPRLLCNVHLDTVPDGGSWPRDPLSLIVEADRAFGLGACDAKGGAACLLAAVESTPGDLAILFSTDEEGSDDQCVRDFLSRDDIDGGERRGRAAELFAGVVVGEPTLGRAVTAHRGMATAEVTFAGRAGHGSEPRAMHDNAIHAAVRWSSSALQSASHEEARQVGGLGGIRLNLGTVQGGSAANVIADRCALRFGVRSRPGEDPVGVVEKLAALQPAPVEQKVLFVGPPLPPPGQSTAAGEALAQKLGLPLGPPVDFWTEASLFAAAGLPAVVFGPGSIGEAHAAGEWVALSELDQAYDRYRSLVAKSAS